MKKFLISTLVIAVVFTPYAPAFSQTLEPGQDSNPKTDTDPKTGEGESPPEREVPILEKPEEEVREVNQPQQQSASAAITGGSEYHPARAPYEQKLNFEADQHTGAFTYTYPIKLPEARNNLTPDLSLVYNSQDKANDNIVGYGWSLSIPDIKRIQKAGQNKLFTEHLFSSTMSGELVGIATTTPDGYGTYAARVENGDFLHYEYQPSSWTVTDKNGTTYKFGINSSARQSSTPDISRWMLEEVRDTNNNFIKYEYYTQQAQVYPSRIIYNGNGTTNGVFEVRFSDVSRQDNPFTYDKGFEIQTNNKINGISVWVNGTRVRQYDISHTTGDNGVRSLIGSITETGFDDNNNSTALPPTQFTYQTNLGGWDDTHNYTLPPWPAPQMAQQNGADFGVRLLDVSGNGLTDMIWGGFRTGSVRNNGDQLVGPGGLGSFAFITGVINTRDNGYRFANLNNDRFIDAIQSLKDENNNIHRNVYHGSPTGWNTQPAQTFPTGQLSEFMEHHTNGATSQNNGFRLFDFNGDGLADMFKGRTGGLPYFHNIYLNNGDNTGWTEVTSQMHWPFDWVFESGANTVGNGVADINGDGLIDLYQRDGNRTSSNGVYFNDGSGFGWNVNEHYYLPQDIRSNLGYGRTRLADMNGDGLLDIIFFPQNATQSMVYLNRNEGTVAWSSIDNRFIFPPGVQTFINSNGEDLGVRLVDINGDGMTDFVQSNGHSAGGAILLSTNKPADLMIGITHASGANTSVEYKSSARYFDNGGSQLNPNLHTIIQTVEEVSTNNGLGVSTTVNYVYEGGHFYYENNQERQLAGFHKVTATHDDGTEVISYFHQGNGSDTASGENTDDRSKIGYLYREDITDNNNNLFQSSLKRWENVDLGGNRDFVKLSSEIELDYDGNSNHRDRAERYTYDNTTGNLTQKEELGEVLADLSGTIVDVANDKYTTAYTYSTNSLVPAMQLLASETTTNQSGTKVRETRRYYDALPLGQATKGNETKVERWIEGTTYVDTEKTYDPTDGFVTQELDERNTPTNFIPGPHRIYPGTATNALGHATIYLYDYTAGKAKRITDPNGYVFTTQYDGLDRVVEERQPDIANSSNQVTKTRFTYTDTGLPRVVQRTDLLDDTNQVETYTYLDGLERPVQERREHESINYVVKDTTYNNIGEKASESLPYFSSGSGLTTATTDTNLYSNFSYDAMRRVTQISTVVGNTAHAYDQWKQTITDPNSNNKDLTRDAYDRLAQVDEHNTENSQPVVYTTRYSYDANNQLTNITDALGNVRNFVYDGLARRRSAEDLHAPSDTSFGTWLYTYTPTGQVEELSDPKGQVVRYGHDLLNRVVTEDLVSVPGVEVSYVYEACENGVGRLCLVITDDAITSYAYDPIGNQKLEIKEIDLVGYLNEQSHDRQGNAVSMRYPDDSEVAYTYNTAGLIESVTQNSNSLVTNIDYSPTGLPSVVAYQNGVTTNNNYDATELYRLRTKTTQLSGGPLLQSIAYTYDSVGNITNIVDASATNASKTAVYGYDDLYRLTSVNVTNTGNGQNYNRTYTYDALGNILSKSDQGSYQYLGHQGTNYANPHAVTNIGSSALAYDNNGNLLTNGRGLALTWDYRNRVSNSTVNSSNSTDYGYDHNNQRVSKAIGNDITFYPSKYFETDSEKNTKHVYAGNLLLASIENNDGSDVVYYTHSDHLTGSNVITDSSGTQTQLLDYYPFGEVRIDQKAGSFDETNKFTGYELDETGLYYAGARYYNGPVGRFVSVDPAFLAVGTPELDRITRIEFEQYLSNPQVANSYSYTINNPLRLVDKDGEFVQIAIGAGVGFLGGVASVYVGDIVSNLANGATGLDAFRSNSSFADYTKGALTGAAVGAAVGTGGAAGVLLGGAVAGGGSVIGDIATGNEIDYKRAAFDTGATILTGGLFKVSPKVPGRLPNFGTKAFFTGKHTQRSLINESAAVGFGYSADVGYESSTDIQLPSFDSNSYNSNNFNFTEPDSSISTPKIISRKKAK